MADITMCSGLGCKVAKQCYRYTAEADEMQSYFVEPPMKGDGTCDYLWERKPLSEETLDQLIREVFPEDEVE